MKPTFWNFVLPLAPLAICWIILWFFPEDSARWLMLAGICVSVFFGRLAHSITDDDLERVEFQLQLHMEHAKERLDGHREELTAIQSLMDPRLKREWNSRTTKGPAGDGSPARSSVSTEGGGHANS